MENEIQLHSIENTSIGMLEDYCTVIGALDFFEMLIIILAIILGIVFVVRFFTLRKKIEKCEADEVYKNGLIKKQVEKLIFKITILIGVSFFVSYIISAFTVTVDKPIITEYKSIIYLYSETTEEICS